MALENIISISFTDEELTTLNAHLEGIQKLFAGKQQHFGAKQQLQYKNIFTQHSTTTRTQQFLRIVR